MCAFVRYTNLCRLISNLKNIKNIEMLIQHSGSTRDEHFYLNTT